MGTNYYLTREQNRCECCGRADTLEELHIGKSSGGWAFKLRIHREEGINSLDDWIKRWSQPTVVIHDGYGKSVPPAEMLDTITNRAGTPECKDRPRGYVSWEEFHRANYSYYGPHNLLFSTWQVVASEETYQLF